MRILKGYNKDEQKELANAKRKYMNGSNLLQIIAGVPLDAGCGFIWRKYDKAEPDEQASIIKDIIDFYTDKAKFTGSKKYYVHFIKNDEYSYLNINTAGEVELLDNSELGGWKNKFTIDEVAAIDPRFVLFMEEVEDDQ